MQKILQKNANIKKCKKYRNKMKEQRHEKKKAQMRISNFSSVFFMFMLL